MATTRLRRTFHYPADSEDEDAVEEGMDERDQEELISTLSTHDTTSTTLYTRILLILPLAPLLLHLPGLTARETFVQSIRAVFSLLCSAYTLYFLPLPPATYASKPTPMPGSRRGKTISRDDTGAKSAFSAPETRHVPLLNEWVVELLRKFVIPVNTAICAQMVLLELFKGRTWSEGMMIGGGYLPPLILAAILWARRELRVVDLGELERLRYRTKGG